ncbi:MAG TPA: glycogen synthase GlgA [bacterium]|nr:glycogen synthase GlgA [bacterium]
MPAARSAKPKPKTPGSGVFPKLKILFVASEVEPFAKTGGLADVVGSLPSALMKLGCEVAVVLPKYKAISREKYKLQVEIKGMQVPMGMGEVDANILSTRLGNSHGTVYLIEADRYFDRDGFYGTPEGDYHDNAERFAFFSRAVLEMLKSLQWYPDILHLNDWQTGLVAPYLETIYRAQPHFEHMRSLFTIHNMAYQGIFPKYVLPMTGLSWDEFKADKLEFYDQINYLKAGLIYSTALNTVSPTYAKEIQTDEFGYGLQGVLRDRSSSLFGILNGLDYGEWNPATDKELPALYTPKNLEHKLNAKRQLLKETGLRFDEKTPVIGLVSRLVDQKGLDLIAGIVNEMLAGDAQFVIQGLGDPRYHVLFQEMRNQFPDKISLNLKYDNRLAKLIYAGSDLFLMPSRFEPCGLGQLIAMKYGTVPVVRKTGGLADTVENLSLDGKKGTGFVFEDYRTEELLATVRRALEAFGQPKLWKGLVQRAMARDFSWDASAQQYLDLYRRIRFGA